MWLVITRQRVNRPCRLDEMKWPLNERICPTSSAQKRFTRWYSTWVHFDHYFSRIKWALHRNAKCCTNIDKYWFGKRVDCRKWIRRRFHLQHCADTLPAIDQFYFNDSSNRWKHRPIHFSTIELYIYITVDRSGTMIVRHYFEPLCVRRARHSWESRALRSRAPFVFLRPARDVFGSRFAHIKRQMSFYGRHRHPGTACRESPVGILCQNFPSSQTSPFPGHGRLIKILNGPRRCDSTSRSSPPPCPPPRSWSPFHPISFHPPSL